MLALLAASPNAYGEEKVLSIGIVPQQSASRLAKIWVPVLDEWSKQAGVKLSFSTAKDIPTFEACLAVGAYDMAYMNPYHYTVFHGAPGYKAFAKQRDKKLKGLIVARIDSDIDGIEQLDNARLAFPSPAAFGASVIPRAEFKKNGINFEPQYVRSHDSVYRAVSAGLMPAGGGVVRTFNTVAPEIRAQLKVIYETDAYTPHAFAAHPDLPAQTVEKIITAMESRVEILKGLGMSGIERAQNSDWDDVRALNLDQSQTEIVRGETVECHSG